MSLNDDDDLLGISDNEEEEEFHNYSDSDASEVEIDDDEDYEDDDDEENEEDPDDDRFLDNNDICSNKVKRVKVRTSNFTTSTHMSMFEAARLVMDRAAAIKYGGDNPRIFAKGDFDYPIDAAFAELMQMTMPSKVIRYVGGWEEHIPISQLVIPSSVDDLRTLLNNSNGI